MNKSFVIYFFALLIFSSIAIPTCLSLLEISCEHTSITKEAEEESESTESTESKEIKILNFNSVSIIYRAQNTSNNIAFFAQEYNSIIKKVNSPPPRLVC